MITQHKYNEEMVSCIMGTYGNFDVACEALTCFLHQDYQNKELIIVNHHEVPLHFTHPQVTVLNLKPDEVPTLRHVKMVGIQKSNGKYIHFWDNDDLYLPWHLTNCMEGIKNTDKAAWKPGDVWMSFANKRYDRSRNLHEGSWIFDRTRISLDEYYTKHPEYADPPFYWDILMERNIEEPFFGALTSYVYRWQDGLMHHSTIENPKTGSYVNDYSVIAKNYRKHFSDTGDGQSSMKVVDLKKYWKDIIDNCLQPPAASEVPELYDEKMKKKLEEKFAPYIKDCGCGKNKTQPKPESIPMVLEKPKTELKSTVRLEDNNLTQRIQFIEDKLGIVHNPPKKKIKKHEVRLKCTSVYSCGECGKEWSLDNEFGKVAPSQLSCPHCNHSADYVFKS
tara:strand:- start:8545 stop:9720 length:1176 start_codon:yes stop_codon:yes gene_type:complete